MSTPTTPKRAHARRGEGQWALGYREPLNPNERGKKDDNPLNVRDRIENIYAHTGFAGIDPGDLRGRFRWFGLYTQRKPGIDGGRTATLEPEELDDEFFMLRIRIDGGAVTTEQLRVIGEISETYARDTADITDRQNIQYHWIRVEDMPAIWAKLEDAGMTTMEACGDSPRVILGSPVAGIAEDEVLDGSPAIEEIKRRYVGDKAFANLPRKFKTAVSGLPDVAHEVHDVAFVGVDHPEHGPGFDVWVGGGLSTNPMIGQRLGAWVPLDEVPDVWAGVISIFRDYGYRRLRHRARIKFAKQRALPSCHCASSSPPPLARARCLLDVELFVERADNEAAAVKDRKRLPHGDELAGEFAQPSPRSHAQPVEPGRFVILGEGIVVAILRMAELVAGKQHRRSVRQHHGGKKIALLPLAQRNDLRGHRWDPRHHDSRNDCSNGRRDFLRRWPRCACRCRKRDH